MRAFLLFFGLLAYTISDAQFTFDARIVENPGMRYACNGEVVPVLKIINDGSQPMSGCVVETWKNGLLAGTFDWQLTLPSLQGEVRRPVFPAVPAVPGDIIEMRIISVNTVPDENADGNFLSFEVEAFPPVATSYVVEVRSQASDLPGSVSWRIEDNSATVVASSGLIELGTDEEASTWVELQSTMCYSLIVQAEGGGFAGGTVAIRSLDAPVVIVEGSTLIPEARAGFVTGTIAGVPEAGTPSTLRVFPSPTSGPISVARGANGPYSIEVFDATGRVVHTARGVGQNVFVDPGHLSAGSYQVVLTSSAGVAKRATFLVVH